MSPILHRGWDGAPVRGGVVALGNFDGVHRGHAHLLRLARAARPDAPLAVLTFEPHPRELFRPDDPPFRLTLSANERRLRIEVTDARAERLPGVPRPVEGDAESGRGLLLVAALADRWGVTSGPFPAKTVWAEVEVTGP